MNKNNDNKEKLQFNVLKEKKYIAQIYIQDDKF